MIELAAVIYLDPEATGVPKIESMSTSKLQIAVNLVGYIASCQIEAPQHIAIGEEQDATARFPYGEVFRPRFSANRRFELMLGELLDVVGYLRVKSVTNREDEWTYDKEADTLRRLEPGEEVTPYFPIIDSDKAEDALLVFDKHYASDDGLRASLRPYSGFDSAHLDELSDALEVLIHAATSHVELHTRAVSLTYHLIHAVELLVREPDGALIQNNLLSQDERRQLQKWSGDMKYRFSNFLGALNGAGYQLQSPPHDDNAAS